MPPFYIIERINYVCHENGEILSFFAIKRLAINQQEWSPVLAAYVLGMPNINACELFARRLVMTRGVGVMTGNLDDSQ